PATAAAGTGCAAGVLGPRDVRGTRPRRVHCPAGAARERSPGPERRAAVPIGHLHSEPNRGDHRPGRGRPGDRAGAAAPRSPLDLGDRAMSAAPIGCTVYIDGVPISDGCSAVSHDAPAVLSGLRIVWGRTSSVDQATASSCSFAIDDPLTGERIVPSLTIGRTVDVHADTVIYPDPDVSTIPVRLPGPTSNVQQVTGAGSTTNVVLAGREYRAANVV